MLFLGPLLVFLIFIVPGIRLLMLARQTRQVPELWCGLYFVGAAFGLSLRLLGSSLHLDQPELAETVNSIGHYAFAAGAMAMSVFTLRVFHPSHLGARIFAGGTIAAIAATTTHTMVGGFASLETSNSIMATNFARLVPTAWAFYESVRYWNTMVRRESLGLADPVVTNRFLLWSVWTGTVTLLPTIVLALRLVGLVAIGDNEVDRRVMDDVLPRLLGLMRLTFALLAPIAAVALLLSFIPPARYLNWVRVRAERSETRVATS